MTFDIELSSDFVEDIDRILSVKVQYMLSDMSPKMSRGSFRCLTPPEPKRIPFGTEL